MNCIKFKYALICISLLLQCLIINNSLAGENSNYDLAVEYIHELKQYKDIESVARADTYNAKTDRDKVLASIHSCQSAKLEIETMIRRLEKIDVSKSAKSALQALIKFNKTKILIYNNIIINARNVLGIRSKEKSEQDNMVDTADHMERLDKSSLNLSVLVYEMLVDVHDNRNKNIDRLKITKIQKYRLIRSIKKYFGEYMKNISKPWEAGAAYVLFVGLNVKAKAADEL